MLFSLLLLVLFSSVQVQSMFFAKNIFKRLPWAIKGMAIGVTTGLAHDISLRIRRKKRNLGIFRRVFVYGGCGLGFGVCVDQEKIFRLLKELKLDHEELKQLGKKNYQAILNNGRKIDVNQGLIRASRKELINHDENVMAAVESLHEKSDITQNDVCDVKELIAKQTQAFENLQKKQEEQYKNVTYGLGHLGKGQAEMKKILEEKPNKSWFSKFSLNRYITETSEPDDAAIVTLHDDKDGDI